MEIYKGLIDQTNIVGKFPFHIRMVRTDNGHGFQSKFHMHCEGIGVQHVYVKFANLNRKVERSYIVNKREFY
ncbi:hypothetical protein CWC15_16710 [Pseudoalteromonas spongiae]|nr:hypothetical protein CWC15_16710 [Pseudoalteromonas spongiae]